MQLSEKELFMVSESVMAHMGTIEKFRSFSQACNDQEMKQLLDSHCNRMERHNQELMNMVQTGAWSSGMSQYSQSQYGGSYGTQQGLGFQSQSGSQPSSISQSQYGNYHGMGSQYGTQQGGTTQGQYGVGSQSQYQQKY